jgi:hypothetical protein
VVLDISAYQSELNLSYLVFVNEQTIILGKGEKLIAMEIPTKSIPKEISLNLLSEIR